MFPILLRYLFIYLFSKIHSQLELPFIFLLYIQFSSSLFLRYEKKKNRKEMSSFESCWLRRRSLSELLSGWRCNIRHLIRTFFLLNVRVVHIRSTLLLKEEEISFCNQICARHYDWPSHVTQDDSDRNLVSNLIASCCTLYPCSRLSSRSPARPRQAGRKLISKSIATPISFPTPTD